MGKAVPVPPPCSSLGRQCRELTVTLRIADLREDSQTLQDATATWLLGRTERITFGRPYVGDGELLVRATVHVPCKYLTVDMPRRQGGSGARGALPARCPARCSAYGYEGELAPDTPPPRDARRQVRRDPDLFAVFFKGERRWLTLPLKRAAQRALPVLQNANPCVGAPCRTADNKRGAACCRDLTLDVVVPESDQTTEAFLRSRKSPYLCKVTRTSPRMIECEVISACAYLEEDDISCGLHDRLLPNNQLAKPSICREWPSLGEDEVAHPGCRLART